MELTPDFIARHWPLRNPRVVEILKTNSSRFVYRVSADEGDFVFKVGKLRVQANSVAKDTRVIEFLQEQNFPAQRLLRLSSGQRYFADDDKSVCALSFIEAKEPVRDVVTYEKLGALTGRLHSLAGCDVVTDFTVATEIPKMLEKAERFNMDPRYVELVRRLPDLEPLPKCLIHTDVGSHNALELASGELVLVDWDYAGVGTRVLDVAFPLINEFITHDLFFHRDQAVAYFSAYDSLVKLTDLEKAHLFDASLFFALMYTIFDDGIVDGQWRKVLFAVENKEQIISGLRY